MPRRRIEQKVATGCSVCGHALERIGEVTSQRLEWVPGHVEVLEVACEKCVCKEHPAAGVVTAEPPSFALPRALCANGLLTKVLVDKFADHIPLHRQCARFEREGLDLTTSTLCGWVKSSADLLGAVYRQMQTEILASRWVQADATGFPVQDGAKGELRKGQLFTYGNGDHILFVFSDTKQGTQPAAHLAGFQGEVVLVDGGSEFNLITSAGVVRAGCWSHARRRFFQAREEEPRLAQEALEQIRGLFMVERARGSPAAELDKLRQTISLPILLRFKTWLHQRQGIRPTSLMGQAVSYTLNQWDRLVAFVDHPHIPIHNNTAERSLRQPVIGRKNWMFAGSDGGAKAAAIHFSLVASCIHHSVDPSLYLRDVLDRLPEHKATDLHQLTPSGWRAARLAASV